MKKYLLTLPFLLGLSGCGQEELPYKSLIKSQGLYYDRQTEEVFSGIANDSSSVVYGTLIGIGATNFKISSKLQCISEFDQGELNGETTCMNQDGDVLVELNFSQNKLDGLQTVHHQSSGELYFEAEYSNNKIEGDKKIYNADGDLIYESFFEGGYKKNETVWTEDSEIVTRKIDEDSGFEWKMEDIGSWPHTHNGLCKINYRGFSNFQEHGQKECFHIPKESRYDLSKAIKHKDDAKQALSGEYRDGKKIGLWVERDNKGNITKETEYSS